MPFKRVIECEAVKLGHGLCAVHTSKADLYTRLWCVHEVAEAKETQVPIFSAMSEEYAAAIVQRMRSLFVYGCDDMECLRGTGILCNSSAARSSRAEDERDLISAIKARNRGGFAALDEAVLQFRLHHLPPMVEAMVFFARLRNRGISAEERRTVLQGREKLATGMLALQQAEVSGDLLCSVIAIIIAQLEDPAKDVRNAAPAALAAVASKVSEADVVGVVIPAVQTKLSDRADARMAALLALPAIAREVSATEVLAAIIRAIKPTLGDEFRPLHLTALAALASVASKVSRADGAADEMLALIPSITAKLGDEQHLVRRKALEALAAAAGSASTRDVLSTIIPAIQAKLEDEREEVITAALGALASVAVQGDAGVMAAILPAVTSQLASSEWSVREASLKALAAVARVGADAITDTALESIESKLQDEYSNVRREAVKALAAIGISLKASEAEAIASIISIIQRALQDNDDDPDVRNAAVDALAAIEPSVAEGDPS